VPVPISPVLSRGVVKRGQARAEYVPSQSPFAGAVLSVLVVTSLFEYDRASAVGVNRVQENAAMNSLLARLKLENGRPVVGRSEVPLDRVIERLERGEGWADTARSLEIESLDVLAAVVAAAVGEPNALGLGLIRGTPRHPALRAALTEAAIRSILPKTDRAKALALLAGLLQIHDFWDESHEAAQLADDLGEREFSAYWHAIAHRREPDPGNAAYWFRRVGRHPVFVRLWDEARPIIDSEGHANTLGSANGWNPDAFITFCSRARPGSKDEALARRIQRIEMISLLDATAWASGLD
jgi:hypothetical protein